MDTRVVQSQLVLGQSQFMCPAIFCIAKFTKGIFAWTTLVDNYFLMLGPVLKLVLADTQVESANPNLCNMYYIGLFFGGR
jgi:hypothetical protein